MMKVTYKRLGGVLVSLAVPFMLVAPVAAAPSGAEVGNVAVICIVDAGIDISTCQGAVTEGLFEVVEGDVNGSLADGGVVYSIDLGAAEGSEPGDFSVDINDVAINPLPPTIAVPPVPGIVYP